MPERLEIIAAKLRRLRGLFLHGLRYSWLTFSLIALLVIQSHAFNFWLDVNPTEYLVRRTLSSAALGFLLFGPAFLMSKKIKYWYLGIMSSATALLFAVQFLYYEYAEGFLQPSAFSYFREGATMFSAVKILLSWRMLIFAAGPILVAAAHILTRRGLIKEPALSKKWKIAMTALTLFSVIFGNGYLFLREATEGGFSYIYEYHRLANVNRLVSKVGILNFSIGNAVWFGLQTDEVSAADMNALKAWTENRPKTATATTSEQFAMARGRNLIIIQVEALENAVIGEKIGDGEITPNLNALAGEGLYFPNYYAPVGPGTTADAEFMTQTSLFALPDKVAFICCARRNYAALPALLKQQGYATANLHGDVPSFWNRANMYPRLGYEKIFGRNDFTVSREVGAYKLSDEDFFAQAVPKLKALPRPFMATLITLSSHMPFELPVDLNTFPIPPDAKLTTLQKNYVQSVHYADAAIGKFIADLKAADLYDNSLIAVFGDHGSFTDIEKILVKPHTVSLELQKSQVPLILLAPGTALKGVGYASGSHLDFYPTVANLLGVAPPDPVFGQNLLNAKTPAVVHRRLISGTIKSILTDKLAYESSPDGVFEDGNCLELPGKKRLPIAACRIIYEEKEKDIRASDMIVKGNLIPALYGAHQR